MTTTRLRMRDTFVLDGALHHTKAGYIGAYAKIARTGIQIYRGFEMGKPDVETIRVYRPEEEVFKVDAMRGMAHMPVTLVHPPEMVDASNWGKFARGQTSDPVVRDGEFVRVPVTIMDARAVKAIDEGIRELSVGYWSDIVWGEGVTPKGEKYDAMQTNIEPNHLAIVPSARGGSRLRLGDASPALCPQCGARVPPDAEECPACGFEFDEDDATQDATGMKCADCGKAWKDGQKQCDCGSTKMVAADGSTKRDAARVADTRGKKMAHKILLDGHKLEVADEVTGTVIEKFADAATKRFTEAEAALKKATEDARAAEAAHATAIDALRKEVGTKDGQIAVLQQQVKDAEITPERLQALVTERAGVIDAAKPMLARDFAFDKKTVIEIQRAAVSAKMKDAGVADWSVDKVIGAFEMLKGSTARGGADHLARGIEDHGRRTANDYNANDRGAAVDAARDETMDWKANAWKGDAGQTRQ